MACLGSRESLGKHYVPLGGSEEKTKQNSELAARKGGDGLRDLFLLLTSILYLDGKADT